jgi:SAM-dependent methyltransferase
MVMESETQQLARQYNQAYQQAHFFNHQASVERPFLEILCRKAGLRPGVAVLDAGCGQGFFTWLFGDLGFKAVGVDISGEGILAAQKEYGSGRARFEVGDISELPYGEVFDCVFCRCFSPYNSEDFEVNRKITDVFLRYVKSGGIFLFIYYSILDPRKKSPSWIYHSWRSVKRHFACYPGTKIYYSRRATGSRLGTFTLSWPMTVTDALISRSTGRGGYFIAIVRKS